MNNPIIYKFGTNGVKLLKTMKMIYTKGVGILVQIAKIGINTFYTSIYTKKPFYTTPVSINYIINNKENIGIYTKNNKHRGFF